MRFDLSGDPLFFAYIGPGAGFAFLGSFLSLVVSTLLLAGSFLLWPFRLLGRFVRGLRSGKRAQIRRLIFLGLDGLDPGLTERFMAEGKLPNLQRLKDEGSFQRLRTTFPALSPVAWSTFATGVSPAKHNIFDFLNRNLRTYGPELSSAKVGGARRSLEFRRKSQSFWTILARHAVPTTILRVPITFPPERFEGRLLSAMCAPDLRGTQGSFSQFTTRLEKADYESGSRYPLHRVNGHFTGSLEGPAEDANTLTVPFRLWPSPEPEYFTLEIDGQKQSLRTDEYSPWLRVSFGRRGSRVRGLVRFLITETSPDVSLYVTPIQIDPESPALPISQPSYYSSYLAKQQGRFATAGMAEDTWALNESVIDEGAFLEQAYLTLAEREAMFRNALDRMRRGVVACVFDTSDRVQHMFYRHLNNGDSRWRGVIEDLYVRMDRIAGEAMRRADKNTVLFVLSDHGFCSFRRAVNLNTWLYQNGYLALAEERSESGRYFEGVDWSRTRAYCLGLSGMYVNLRGRESQGVVAPGREANELKGELAAKLSGLRDGAEHSVAIRRIYATEDLYRGPYLDAAPDLIVGYNKGYRTSWDAAVGKVSRNVIEDNPKAWSGDHCVDPELVPGVLFCNRRVEAANPGIEDMAPTALELFGIRPPEWIDGRSVFRRS